MAASPELFPVVISLRVDGLEPPVFLSASWTQWKLETLGYSFQRTLAGDKVFIFWKHTSVKPGEHLFIFSKQQNWFVDPTGALKKDEFGRTCNVVWVRKPYKQTPSEAGNPDGDEVVDNTNVTCGWVDTNVPLCVRSLSGQTAAAGDGDETAKPCKLEPIDPQHRRLSSNWRTDRNVASSTDACCGHSASETTAECSGRE